MPCFDFFPGLFLIFLIWIIPLEPAHTQQPLSRDMAISIAVNQVGYPTKAHKQCVLLYGTADSFHVIEAQTGETVYTAEFESAGGEFGNYKSGVFTKVTHPGRYYINTDTGRSYPFVISDDVYDAALNATLNYLQVQRCGRSTTGFLSPCHLDDGVRMDNGKHMDGTGGWHDACDVRKEVSGTIFGMIGLSHYYHAVTDHALQSQILDELLWGNHYFLNMQEPDGYVMKGIGPTVLAHADNNRWTDNKIGEFGGDLRLVLPDTGRATDSMSIFGEKDDRIVNTDPAADVIQFNFVYAQALLTDIVQPYNPDYSQRCLRAAETCMTWCLQQNRADHIDEYGSLVRAAAALFQTTRDRRYRQLAVEYTDKILDLQVRTPDDSPVSGFFHGSESRPRPRTGSWVGDMPLLALCIMAETFPQHSKSEEWLDAVSLYTRRYLQVIAERNAFGFVPFALFNDNPGSGRPLGDYWYRYFTPVRPLDEGEGETFWRVQARFAGTNSNTLSAAIGLIKAARLLDDPDLRDLAQQQLNWILGLNPVQAGTMEGFGYDVMKWFVNVNEYFPVTPRIKGGVMNGIAGTADDQPVRHDQSWQTSEYWIPHVGHAMWLFCELQK